ncbi:MAG: hypothetical protein ACLP1X_24805 [Polyangiaceae bacterium]
MLKLEPLVARLVEDVLRAIGRLTLEDLRDLAAPSAAPSPRKSAAVPRIQVVRRRAERRLALGRVRNWPPAGMADQGSAAPGAIVDRPEGADITDPERLLATARPPMPDRDGGAPTDGEESPAGAVRPGVGSVVPLRPGERLASASGASVVIRRAKKA